MPQAASVEQDNLQLVRRLYEAFGRGEIPTVLGLLAPDVEWRVTGPPQVSYAGARRGRQQVVEFFQALAATVEIQQFEPQEFIAQGEQVVVIGRERMRIVATGRIAENAWIMVFTIRGGLVAAFREYDDTAAVAAAHGEAHTRRST